MTGLCKYTLQFGVKEGFKIIIIPRFIDALSDWFKNILNTKLLPLLLERFNQCFELLGTHLIILQKKYNIKNYIDNLLDKITKFFDIICGIQKLIIPYLKEAMKKAKEEGVDTLKIISDFIDQLIFKVDNIIKPIKEFIDKVFDGNEKIEVYKLYENIIVEGYKKARKIGIEKYQKIKNIANDKYIETKKEYLDKRKEICNLPDELEQKFKEQKEELIKKYQELRDNIIISTNEKIENLKKMNLEKEFKEFFRNLKDNIINQLNEIKDEAKNKITSITSKIPNFFDNFTNLIDEIIGLNFGPFNEKKIDISEHIMNFILEIVSGNIEIQYKNENEEVILEDAKKLLINYLNEKLNINAKDILELVEYLFKNGLKSILFGKINNLIINYASKKLEILKSYYEPTLTMIRRYFITFKGDISNFINKCNDKIKGKIDYLDYFIKYINNIFQNKYLYELYYMIEENILIYKDFKNSLLDEINQLKNKLINNLSNELEKKTNELYEKIINDNKYKEFKEKSKKTINEIVDKTENKVFGYINNIIMDKDEKNKTKKSKTKKNNKESEFDKFDKNIGNIIDNKICLKASELERQLIKYTKSIDNQAQDYLKLKFSNKVDKKKIDVFFKSIEILKEKKSKIVESEKIKNNFKKLDNTLLKVANSQELEKGINFIDGINIKLANKILVEIKNISSLLEVRNKEEFRDNIKQLIKEKIYQCYEKYLEPKIKDLVIKTGEEIVETIAKKVLKNKNK